MTGIMMPCRHEQLLSAKELFATMSKLGMQHHLPADTRRKMVESLWTTQLQDCSKDVSFFPREDSATSCDFESTSEEHLLREVIQLIIGKFISVFKWCMTESYEILVDYLFLVACVCTCAEASFRLVGLWTGHFHVV